MKDKQKRKNVKMLEVNPGSKEAIKAGCKCPVIDNNHGKGTGTGSDGRPLFWYSSDCQIHCKGQKHEDDEKIHNYS